MALFGINRPTTSSWVRAREAGYQDFRWCRGDQTPKTVVGRGGGARKWSYPKVTSESLGWPPSVGSWLSIVKNSRASHSKAKEGLFTEETFHRQSVGRLRRQERQGIVIVSFDVS